jgi:aspartyl-tRNA(Asn)/glutamyl-tRNA(Gln) amidotransferase subunit A
LNPCYLSAGELLAAYQKRQLSPVEVTRAVLERIDRLNPLLNAFLTIDHEGALAAARRAEEAWRQPGEKPLLCGVPVSIKDLIYTSWLPTTHGSLLFRDYRHPDSSPVVERLLAAGAIVLGKTNTPEFGLLDMTFNRLRDECRNPWAFDRTAGGSSGGAGAQVAAGLGPLAVGTDGAGSIRIPAMHCGIFGLKPTFGRIAHTGWKGAPRSSHQGPMTRTVRDAALMMQATAGPDPRDPLSVEEPPPDFLGALNPRPLAVTRVAYSPDYGYLDVDPEIRQAVLDAAALLRELGCELIESHPPRRQSAPGQIDLTPADEYAYAIEICPDIDNRLDELTDYGRRAIEAGRKALAWQHSAATRRRDAWATAIRRWFQDFDYFVAPVMGAIAPRHDEDRHFDEAHPWPGTFLPPFNASGNPAASVPWGFHSAGVPLAVQIAGRWGDDSGVLRLCAALEAARPWAQHWPDLARAGAIPEAQKERATT